MGNIINLSPGDLTDRQTILEIKLSHCGTEADNGLQPTSQQITTQDTQRAISRTVLLDKTQINIQPFIIEHEAIQQRMELDWFSKLTPETGEKFNDLMEDLRNINSELWKLEDQARILRVAPDKHNLTILRRKAECLDAITLNNDLRIGVVQKINALWGISIQEKIYT